MDSQSRAELERILAQDPPSLTEAEWAFLKARRSYLNPEQEATFFPKGKASAEETPEAPVAPKKRK